LTHTAAGLSSKLVAVQCTVAIDIDLTRNGREETSALNSSRFNMFELQMCGFVCQAWKHNSTRPLLKVLDEGRSLSRPSDLVSQRLVDVDELGGKKSGQSSQLSFISQAQTCPTSSLSGYTKFSRVSIDHSKHLLTGQVMLFSHRVPIFVYICSLSILKSCFFFILFPSICSILFMVCFSGFLWFFQSGTPRPRVAFADLEGQGDKGRL